VHITSAHHYLDSRIFYKECRAAAAAGHETVLIAPGAEPGVISGVSIEPVPKARGRLHRVSVTLYRIWRKALVKKADIYHFHDPELIVVGLLLKIRGKTVVYDVHEHLPNQILGKPYLGPRAVRATLAAVARVAEGLAARAFDGFCAAAPSIGARFPKRKTVLLRNFVELSLVDSIDPAALGGADGRKIIIYPGSLSKARGIGNVIDAVGRLGGELELWLFGRWHDREFEASCRRSEGWQYTRYFGRQSQESVVAHIKAADIGVHLPLVAPNYSDGLAVKGFEFMACRKPFVTTDEPAKRRTFGDCAVFTDAADVDAIEEAIIRTVMDSELCAMLGNKGRNCVENKYSWEIESQKLLALYDRLAADQNCQDAHEAPGDTMQ
jgi:glycosyltransferase involved in cell wall biosynthesis